MTKQNLLILAFCKDLIAALQQILLRLFPYGTPAV